MRHGALLSSFRALGLSILPGLFEALEDEDAEAIIRLAEAGRRHAKTDLDRLDAAIRTLVDVRYDDDITRARARKALSSILDIKDALGDPADPEAEVQDTDPEDQEQAVADSRKADKAAKAADQKAAKAKPAAEPAKAEPAAAGGGKSIELKIAASEDDDVEFDGEVEDVDDDSVTFRVGDDSLTFDIHDVSMVAAVAEHPGHNQKEHGNWAKGSKYRAKVARSTWAKAVKKAYAGKTPPAGGRGLRYDRAGIAASDDRASLIAESSGPGGSTWDVLLIQPGTSKNRRRYRREVLQEAVTRGAFRDARAFAPDGPDHFGFGPFGRKRGAKELVGWWSDIAYRSDVTLPDGKAAEGVTGTFHVSEAAPWLRTMLADAWQRGKPDLVGWSIVGDGDMKVVRGDDGRPVADVSRLDVVESIDPVVNPAAGGRTIRLVASEEGAVNWQTLTLAEAVRGLAAGTILPDELKENRPDLFRAVESFEAPTQGDTEGVARKVAETVVEKFRTAQLVEAKIALRPRLAEPIKARIRERANARLAETTLSESDIDAIIKDEVDYVGQFAPAQIRGAGAPVVTDMKSERERMTEAAYDGLTGKDPKFSVAQFYVDLTGDRSFSGKYAEGGRLTEGLLAESFTSSTFDQIMGDSITRRMLDYYNLPGLDSWRQVVNIDNVKDFRTYRRARFGGYANLPSVSQGQPYTALTSPTDEEATFSVTKRGGTEDMTLETIANDDLGAIKDIPRRLGRAASQTLFEFVWDFVKDNPTIYDSVALFHANHGSNLGSTALDAASLAAGRLVMKKQADMSNAKRLGINPRYLVVPSDLEQKAYELTATDREVASANNTLNFIRTFGLTPVVVDYWTDTNNWYLIADPAQVPTIALGFLNGNEQPELFVQDNPTVGNVFTNDKITYKIRHIYGGAVMDYRGFYGAVVA